jgi:hypothetical protein
MTDERRNLSRNTHSDERDIATRKVRAIGRTICKLEPPFLLNDGEAPSAFTMAKNAGQLRSASEPDSEGTQMTMNSTVGRLKIV